MPPLTNPFTITFGKEPLSIISRESDFKIIYESFSSNEPDSEVYIITGTRGSGKTVSMTSISNKFKQDKNWIVVELNPNSDLLEQLASKLIDEGKLKKLFITAEFSFSFKGLGFSISGKEPILNISTLLKREFEYLSKKGYRVLITIDEVSNNEYMKVFASEFQLFIRDHFPVCLLMTGLYKNISLLERQKNLTFLLRAPRIYLGKLNIRAIANSYKNVFEISEGEAIKLAKLTNGYAFAYQLLGNILFASKKTKADKDVLEKYDELLHERSYDLIYEELSNKEKEILKVAAINPQNEYIINELKIASNQLANIKKDLSMKGIIDPVYRSKITFSLPRFKEFLLFMKEFEEE